MSDFLAIQTQTAWGRALKVFAAWCNPAKGSHCLDIGCGPGLLPAIFEEAGCQAFGVDIDLHVLLLGRLHRDLAQGLAQRLPFSHTTFDLVTASNLLFLLPNPSPVLLEIGRVLQPHGVLCVLNPSEILDVKTATAVAEERGLKGIARDSLINWARRAEMNHHWTAEGLKVLFSEAGFQLVESKLQIGPGFARFGRGVRRESLRR